MPRAHPFDEGLDKNAANYTPLSPLSLLARSAYVYPQRPAVVHGHLRLTWSEVYARWSAKPQAARRRKQRAFSYPPIVRDRDNNRARRFHKSSKPPRKRSKKIYIPPGLS